MLVFRFTTKNREVIANSSVTRRLWTLGRLYIEALRQYILQVYLSITSFVTVAIWCSGNALVSINEVVLRWAQLAIAEWLGVTAFRQVSYLAM